VGVLNIHDVMFAHNVPVARERRVLKVTLPVAARIDDTNIRSSSSVAVGCEGWAESWGPSARARQFHGKKNKNNFPRHFATSNQFTTVYVVRASCTRG